jgi:hypothetical protein
MSLSTRKEVTAWLMQMVFFMPTIAAVTTTAGYFLASKMGLKSTCHLLDRYSFGNCFGYVRSGSWDFTAYKSSHIF